MHNTRRGARSCLIPTSGREYERLPFVIGRCCGPLFIGLLFAAPVPAQKGASRQRDQKARPGGAVLPMPAPDINPDSMTVHISRTGSVDYGNVLANLRAKGREKGLTSLAGLGLRNETSKPTRSIASG